MVKLVNLLSEKGRFIFLLRSLHFGSNRLSTTIRIIENNLKVSHIYWLHKLLEDVPLTADIIGRYSKYIISDADINWRCSKYIMSGIENAYK